jgi:addiction module HigA family antidote
MPLAPIHPGKVLSDELADSNMTVTELATQLRVSPNRITRIVQGKRAITGDTALRLGHWFGTSPAFWMNLQSLYDIRLAEQHIRQRSCPAAATRGHAISEPGTNVGPRQADLWQYRRTCGTIGIKYAARKTTARRTITTPREAQHDRLDA